MSGFKIAERGGRIVSHLTLWVDPDENPVFFLVAREGATALAHPIYVESLLHGIDLGDLTLDDAWDDLLVKTPALPYPQKCTVRLLPGTGGGAEIRVGGSTVHRIHGIEEGK